MALLALLTPPANRASLALLVLWVAAYNAPATLALNRADNKHIGLIVRVAAIIDAISYLVLLGIYAPDTPAMLIALFPAVLIEMVVFDGAIGAVYGVAIFVLGLGAIQLLQGRLSLVELVLWGAIMTVIGASLTLSSQVLLGAGAPDVIPPPAARAGVGPATPRLSARELEVLHLVAAGYSNSRQYVSSELLYGGANYGELRARTPANSVGPWEVFDFVSNADGTYSVRSVANGLYVSAELGYTGARYGELRARASAIGAYEKFNLSTTGSGGCVNYGGGNITGPDSCAGTFSTHSIWFSGSPLGLQGREMWTWANGSVQDSTATWHLSGLSTFYVVEIDAFIPRYHSNAQHVHYTLCAPDNGCTAAYVNQSPYYDQWTVVGYVCTSDGTASVTVADDGGDRYPRQIAADAVQGVRTTARCH